MAARVMSWTAMAMGAVVLGTAIWTAVALGRPQTHYGPPSALVVAREQRAAAAFEQEPPDLEAAVLESREALHDAPLSAASWLRVAYAENLQRGAGEDPDTVLIEAIERSYAAQPLGPDVTDWRLSFAYELWPYLPGPLRCRVNTEMQVLASTRTRRARRIAEAVSDPSGRLAAYMASHMENRTAPQIGGC